MTLATSRTCKSTSLLLLLLLLMLLELRVQVGRCLLRCLLRWEMHSWLRDVGEGGRLLELALWEVGRKLLWHGVAVSIRMERGVLHVHRDSHRRACA